MLECRIGETDVFFYFKKKVFTYDMLSIYDFDIFPHEHTFQPCSLKLTAKVDKAATLFVVINYPRMLCWKMIPLWHLLFLSSILLFNLNLWISKEGLKTDCGKASNQWALWNALGFNCIATSFASCIIPLFCYILHLKCNCLFSNS